LRPALGTLAGSSGGAYLFAGLVLELPLPRGFQVAPGFAPGIVVAKGRRDLGSPIEFRSVVEVSRLLVPALRLAVSFSHISNGRLGDHNPGVETLMLGLQFTPAH
jgi:hypothetical protein